MNSLLKKPSSWIPVALSLGIWAMLINAYLTGRLVPQPDEGIEAHIFQLWLVIEVVLIGYFGAKWLPHKRKLAYIILAIQITAVLVALAPVYLLHL